MISHNPKFIFIHIRRTGGSSITTALERYSIHEVILLNNITGFNQGVKFNGFNPHMILRNWKKFCDGNPDNYYIFSCLRNPYERYVSTQKFKKRLPSVIKGPNFRMETLDQYFEGKESEVDYFIDFAHLNQEFEKVCYDLGLENIKLPKMNKLEYGDYKKYFRDESVIKEFRKKYQKDIDLYNKHRVGNIEIDDLFGV